MSTPQVKATLPSVKVLYKAVEIGSQMRSKFNLLCSPQGMNIHVLDDSYIALMDVWLPKNMFTQFCCTQKIALGVKASLLSRILKSLEMDQLITLHWVETSSGLQVISADTGTYFIIYISIYVCCVYNNTNKL